MMATSKMAEQQVGETIPALTPHVSTTLLMTSRARKANHLPRQSAFRCLRGVPMWAMKKVKNGLSVK